MCAATVWDPRLRDPKDQETAEEQRTTRLAYQQEYVEQKAGGEPEKLRKNICRRKAKGHGKSSLSAWW